LGEPVGQTTAVDEKGAVSGTYTGGVTRQQAGLLIGDTNWSARFDGATGYINLGFNYNFSGTAPFSVESLANADPPSPLNTRAIIAANDGLNGWGMVTTASGQLYAFRVGGGVANIAQAAGVLSVATTHHVVMTYDGVTLSLYIDGVLAASVSSPVSLGSITQPLLIGAGPFSSAFWPGYLDEVAIYNYALTPAQITAHYLASIAQQDAPDWSTPVQITSSNVTLPISIEATNVTLNVAITAASATVNVNIASSSATINVSLIASSVTVNISITGQTISVNDHAQYNVTQGNQKTLTGSASAPNGTQVQCLTYTVTSGKTYYIYGMTFGWYGVSVAPYNGWGALFINGVPAVTGVSAVGNTITLVQPLRATSGVVIHADVQPFFPGGGNIIGYCAVWGVEV
jgi:hypothetical protein